MPISNNCCVLFGLSTTHKAHFGGNEIVSSLSIPPVTFQCRIKAIGIYLREEQSRLASLERASPLASITLRQDILTSKLLGAALHEKLMAARRVVLFARLSPLVLGLLHGEHEVCQRAAEGRSCAASKAQPCRSPERKRGGRRTMSNIDRAPRLLSDISARLDPTA